uniref:Uncharacterized protein n=1 Tax=Rhizophora mucronata TaxID=61149 RepID=A0A2P2QLX8_RHIMU
MNLIYQSIKSSRLTDQIFSSLIALTKKSPALFLFSTILNSKFFSNENEAQCWGHGLLF